MKVIQAAIDALLKPVQPGPRATAGGRLPWLQVESLWAIGLTEGRRVFADLGFLGVGLLEERGDMSQIGKIILWAILPCSGSWVSVTVLQVGVLGECRVYRVPGLVPKKLALLAKLGESD